MTHIELRKNFMDYFSARKHTIVPSANLVPLDDPSLLFTTAGMVQFKPLFAGVVDLPYTRATSIQKCFRLSDLENIGKTARHHTFFEMFGNFSFGDYFKKEAIEFAWEFSTEVIKLPKEKIHISIFENDEDAFKIWNEHIGIPKKRIVRLGKKDNFWGPAGDSGACGPCSELYIDMGEERSCGKETCAVGCDCERYLEFWNLVFNEFFQDTKGIQTPLPQTGIDTGMGMERLAYITQGVESNYQTDLMKPVVDSVMNISSKPYSKENKYFMNMIADHIRALTFVMGEGVMPSNEGRGYVLRRLLRRALKAGGNLGIEHSFLSKLISPVVNTYKDVYPYLTAEEPKIAEIIKVEERRFFDTLSQGLSRLEEVINETTERGESVISGKEAFTLFDTYGLPLDIAEEEVAEKGLSINKDEFNSLMENARTRSRGKGADLKDSFSYIEETEETVFTGENIDECESESKVIALYKNSCKTEEALEGESVVFITEKTPFYGEKGGQIGDSGEATTNEARVLIEDVKIKDGVFLHIGKVQKGTLKKESIKLTVNQNKRYSIARNHTATHILQKVLIDVLGEHVKQAGSFVSDERLRFDFSHFKSLTNEELTEIEDRVNDLIFSNYTVSCKEMALSEAKKEGAMALFGEKYGEVVRLVNIGGWSKELCGGSHLTKTSECGYFHIMQESSIASGVRRIEAVTGIEASKIATEALYTMKELSLIMQTESSQMKGRIEKLINENKSLSKEVTNLKTKGFSAGSEDYTEIASTRYYEMRLENEDAKTMRAIADSIREKSQNHVLIMTSTGDKKSSVVAQVAKETAKKVSAKDILNEFFSVCGGRGGGKDTFAQGSAEDETKINDAYESVKKYISEKLS